VAKTTDIKITVNGDTQDLRRAENLAHRLTTAGQAVLAQALREAHASGHNYIGPEHLGAALGRLARQGGLEITSPPPPGHRPSPPREKSGQPISEASQDASA
jgi:hypothetical protein